MDEFKNYLKEIDLEIVHRRLEARKKNITNDGRLSKRQLAVAYRGYHGLESQYQALLHMSNDTMMQTKTKNDHVHQKHVEEMKSLLEKERMARGNASKEIKAMREDFMSKLAYQYVYKNHSFKKIDMTNKKSRPVSDKPEMYDQARKSANINQNIPRPLGSLREVENYGDELKKMLLPPINAKPQEKKTKVNVFGENSYENLKESKIDSIHKKSVFPNIENALGIEVKYRYTLKQELKDKDSLYSAPAGAFDEVTVVGSDGSTHAVALDMGQSLMLMRKKEQERFDRQRMLPVTPSREEARKESWRRVLPPTPSRPSSVFPDNTKNSIGMRKLIKKEATDVISTWSSSHRRLEQVDKVREFDKKQHDDNPLPTFDMKRSMSTIIREFEAYKKHQELSSQHEHNGDKQSIIIRQMSPQPRAESPVSQRRAEYSRIMTPMSKTRPRPESRLRRTDSENIPSVSRPTSYKDSIGDVHPQHEHARLTAEERIQLERIMRGDIEHTCETRNDTSDMYQVHELDHECFPSVSRTTSYQSVPVKPHVNEKLTSAERIELERRNRNRMKNTTQYERTSESEYNPETSRADTPRLKPKRQLPKTPDSSNNNHVTNSKTWVPLSQRILPEAMFNTNVLARKDTDDKIIDEVQGANGIELEIPDETATYYSETIKIDHDESEISQYSQKQKSRGTPKIMTSQKKEQDKTGFISEASKNKLQERLSKKMNFDYDSFSRISPEAKKKLELRTKLKKKIQQKNAKLAEERQNDRRFSTMKDRPRSRVSFNENVIVFQTL